jgi:hypothetical protein
MALKKHSTIELTSDQQAAFERDMCSMAGTIVSAYRDYPFAMNPREKQDKLKEVLLATLALLKAINTLAPKGLGSIADFPFNYLLSMEIDAQWWGLKQTNKEPHWLNAPAVDGININDWCDKPCGRLIQELRRFHDATSEAEKFVKRGRGNAAENTIVGFCKRKIAMNLVFRYRSSFCCYPPMTVEGWPTLLLQKLFDAHSLGPGANHFLKMEIKTQINNGVTREMLKQEAISRVSILPHNQ